MLNDLRGKPLIYGCMRKLYSDGLKNVGRLSGFYGSVASLSESEYLQTIFEESDFSIKK